MCSAITKIKEGWQRTCKERLKCVCVTTFALEKQYILQILGVCL
jgi:hypothetical protein